MEFYAFRNVEWNSPPDAALARATAATGGSAYVYCSGPDDPTPPAGLAGLPYEVDGGCLFFRLR